MAYDLFLGCERGCAPYVLQEARLRGFTNDAEDHDVCLILKELTVEQAIKAAYLFQTPTRIGISLGHATVALDTEESLLALETLIGGLDLVPFFIPGKSFLLTCERDGLHEYNSLDIAQEAGRVLRRHAQEQLGGVAPAVDFKKPELRFSLRIDGEDAWLFFELLENEAAKRQYRVFSNPHGIKGPMAASLLLAGGWTPKNILLDPFAGDGAIGIEAALLATGRSVRFYDRRKGFSVQEHPLFAQAVTEVTAACDKAITDRPVDLINACDANLRNVSASKKNAKIAGVEKSMVCARMDVEWLDTKQGEKSIDRIITVPLEAGKSLPPERAKKIQQEFFYQAEYILKKKGSVVVLCTHPEALAEAGKLYGFSMGEERQVFTGKLPRWIVTFSIAKK